MPCVAMHTVYGTITCPAADMYVCVYLRVTVCVLACYGVFVCVCVVFVLFLYVYVFRFVFVSVCMCYFARVCVCMYVFDLLCLYMCNYRCTYCIYLSTCGVHACSTDTFPHL